MDAILFDLGGVLVDWNPRRLYRPLFNGDDEAMEHFLATVCPPEWNREMDAGRPFAEAITERQQEFPEHAELIALWKTGWEQMLGEAIHDAVAVLDELRARGLRLYALTNWSAETFPVAHGRYPFLGWFEDIIVSGDVKLAKPDPRIFELAIRRFGLTPHATVFIDDNMPNVQAAQKLGLHALCFENPERLREDLRGLGVLS